MNLSIFHRLKPNWKLFIRFLSYSTLRETIWRAFVKLKLNIYKVIKATMTSTRSTSRRAPCNRWSTAEISRIFPPPGGAAGSRGASAALLLRSTAARSRRGAEGGRKRGGWAFAGCCWWSRSASARTSCLRHGWLRLWRSRLRSCGWWDRIWTFLRLLFR